LSALGDAVVCIPPEINTIGLLREYMRIDELQAEHPAHDLFIVAYKTHPDNPFAVLMRLPKELRTSRDAGPPRSTATPAWWWCTRPTRCRSAMGGSGEA
jgi:hypothetical protein